MENESDDETIEFEIEIVTSSSSNSLASNSIDLNEDSLGETPATTHKSDDENRLEPPQASPPHLACSQSSSDSLTTTDVGETHESIVSDQCNNNGAIETQNDDNEVEIEVHQDDSRDEIQLIANDHNENEEATAKLNEANNQLEIPEFQVGEVELSTPIEETKSEEVGYDSGIKENVGIELVVIDESEILADLNNQLEPPSNQEATTASEPIGFEVLREPYKFEVNHQQQVSSVEHLEPLQSEAAKRLHCVEVDHEVLLEPTTLEIILDEVEEQGEEEKGDEEKACPSPPRCKPSDLVEIDDDDLEREFDEEPDFEARQVELKRNRDPRDEYELGIELGRGKFGTVYRCTEQASGRRLAAKFVNMRRREDREDVEREIAIMCQLQHKRLLQLYDAFDDGKSQMCLITELVDGGELFERIIDDDFELTEKKAAIFMRQICEGVGYMHGKQIIHLDMKPENILCLSRTGYRIKLIDFGLARKIQSDEPLRVMFGTPDFAAPEVLAYDTVSLATDMWSVGVICYVLLSGLSPFMGDNDIETMANVTRATFDFDDPSFEPISDSAKDFIARLLVKSPSERLKPAECLQHPWLQRGGYLEAANDILDPVATIAPATGAQLTGHDQKVDVSLDKRNLKKYVVRRKWHKTVHAIMALGRMGANLKLK